MAQTVFLYLCTKYVRKKRNRLGIISVVVVSKAKGYYEEVRSFGTAKTDEDIARLCSEAHHWLNANGG